MKKQNGLLLTICGAAAALLSGVYITFGILEMIERGEYQGVGLNMPVVVLSGLVFVAGVTALIMGVRKMKASKGGR